MKNGVLVIDVGGTNVKVLRSGQKVPLKIPSGTGMTARKMVAGVKKATSPWKYDAVTIGLPAAVVRGRILREPVNLGKGWVRFDFRKAFGKPVRIVNDAAMQALGSYDGGTMLFLGLGTGLGSALVIDGVVAPLELAHLPYKKGEYEDYVGVRAVRRFGKRRWRKHVGNVVKLLKKALVVDYVVLGGGNAKLLKKLPAAARLGANSNAFIGGQRLWEDLRAGS
jgi:predicted NBD/HSP70 family sugar kinase